MGYIYLLTIWDENKPLYKIGITKHEDINLKRIKSLQTGNPSEILLVKKYKSDNYRRIETMLHRFFFNERKVGEWFKLTDEQANSFITKCEHFNKTINILKNNPFYK